jgi:protein-serine/threonine kinase
MLSVIGKGAYGKVLLVKKKEQGNPAGGELYAMKVLKKSEILRRNQVEHTMTERRILVSLPNIKYYHFRALLDTLLL